MRKLDGKFSTDGTRVFNTVSGAEIPEDEPLFILRARDQLAIGTICDYLKRAVMDGCNDLHINGIAQTLRKFSQFATDHPELMKQPGITKHLKLD